MTGPPWENTPTTDGEFKSALDNLVAAAAATDIAWQNRTVTNSNGDVQAIFSKLQDTTEQVNRTLDPDEYATIIEALKDPIYVLDETGEFTFVTTELAELVGYDRETIIGSTPALFKDDEAIDRAEHELSRLLSSDGPDAVTFEVTLQSRSGDSIVCEDHMGVLPYSGDSFNGSVGTLRDITDQRRRERRFQALVEETHDIISIVDAQGQFTYQSPSLERILGYEPEATIGEEVWEYIHPDDRQRVSDEFETWVDSPDHAPKAIEYRAQHADGSWRWMEAYGNTGLDNPAIEGYVFNSRDITDRKERQQQFELVDRVLRHNVRNDMNVIRGKARIIQNNSSGEQAELANQIIETSDDLIDTAETERKMGKLLTRSADPIALVVSPLLQQVTTSIRDDHPEATVTVACPDDVTMRATPQFRQAIEELLTNAIVHNPDEEPEATITVAEDSDTVRIEIADTGPQIPKMERDVLLGNKQRTALDHGSGLGLWFVQLLVSRSGGSIGFERNSPTGNTVTVEIPK
jgi:PAS domain S-box-containing protein